MEKVWTKKDIEYLRNNYGIIETKQIADVLHRSRRNIESAVRKYKIVKKREDNILKDCEGCLFLGVFSNSTQYCNYLTIMKELRGCDISNCRRKMTKENVDPEILKHINKRKRSLEDLDF